MQGFVEIGAVVLGILLRFGIPILATALMILFLRRLDARWQHEAKQSQPVDAEEAPIFSTLRCWILNDCSPEERERCPAFIEAIRPCWQVHRNGNGSLKEDCLECEILTQAPIPVPA